MVGIPYAPAGVDKDGYHVTCPACPQRFYAVGGSEDEATKDPGVLYAAHWVMVHGGDRNNCPWCRPNPPDDADPALLCRSHLAEYEATSIEMLDRQDAAEADELFWARH